MEGCPSPLKKKAPRRPNDDYCRPAADSSARGVGLVPPSVTPSPTLNNSTLSTVDHASGAFPSLQPAASGAAEAEATAEIATTAKPIRKKKSKVQFGAVPAKKDISNHFQSYLRPHTFDADPFSNNDGSVYFDADMSDYDRNFQRQLIFNFAETRAKRKDEARRGLRSMADDDLDSDLDAFGVGTTDRKALSRYVLEDFLRAESNAGFLVLIRKASIPDLEEVATRPEKKGFLEQLFFWRTR